MEVWRNEWRNDDADKNARATQGLVRVSTALKPEALALPDDFAEMLAGVPLDDLDREINNIGHIVMLTMKRTAPQLSEGLRYGLPYAFIEIVARADAAAELTSFRTQGPGENAYRTCEVLE